MKPALEPPSEHYQDASMVAFERKERSFPWSWHFHQEIELTLIRRGTGTRLVGDHSEPYGPGDLVLLGGGLPHTWVSRDGSVGSRVRRHQAVVVQFRAAMLPSSLLALPEFLVIGEMLSAAARGLRFSPGCAASLESSLLELPATRGVSRWLKLVEVLHTLTSHSPVLLASEHYRHGRSYQMSSRLDRVIAYIDEHFREDFSLADIAKVSGLTSGAFSRFFRRYTHRNFVDYRNARRVREACRLLVETDFSIAEIAYQCGFNNLANFNRRFMKEKGMSPRRYRRQYDPGGMLSKVAA